MPELKYFFNHINPSVVTHKVISCEVQTQQGGSACGLFALAFLTAMVCDIDPSSLEFDQALMVNHYNYIINRDANKDFFTFNFMFPHKVKKRDHAYKSFDIN